MAARKLVDEARRTVDTDDGHLQKGNFLWRFTPTNCAAARVQGHLFSKPLRTTRDGDLVCLQKSKFDSVSLCGMHVCQLLLPAYVA